MPLTLVAPRPGRTPHWHVRGTYLGVHVERSARSPRRAHAVALKRRLERQIECGELAAPGGGTLVAAALAYIKAGGERRYLGPLIEHFARTPLVAIDQAAIDAGAAALYPPGISEGPSPHNATINRQVHTPMSAVMAAGGHPLRLKRPKQPAPTARWIEPADATRFLARCPARLRRLATFLLYTGCRITEACRLDWQDVRLAHGIAYLPTTKSGAARAVHLPPAVLRELQAVKVKRGRVLGYSGRDRVYPDWHAARRRAKLPAWFTPHACCHTWATWMRRYAGMDLRGLLATERWRDLKSVLRYTHVVTSDESRAADLLPDLSPRTRAKSVQAKRRKKKSAA